MELSFPIFAGIIAAILHVISGPDHLAAVTPFAIESKKKAWKVGLFWGIGHLLGMLSIGVLFLMFKDLIPIEKISLHSEKFVGLILIGLALWIFFKIFKEGKHHKHTHVHAEGNPRIHTHPHIHEEALVWPCGFFLKFLKKENTINIPMCTLKEIRGFTRIRTFMRRRNH